MRASSQERVRMNDNVKRAQITNQTEFALLIEELVKSDKLTHVEAVMQYCADNFIEPHEIAKMIDGSLKDKMRANFVDMDMLKRTAQLTDI